MLWELSHRETPFAGHDGVQACYLASTPAFRWRRFPCLLPIHHPSLPPGGRQSGALWSAATNATAGGPLGTRPLLYLTLTLVLPPHPHPNPHPNKNPSSFTLHPNPSPIPSPNPNPTQGARPAHRRVLARGPGAAPYHGYMRREAARAGEAVEGLQVTAGEAVGCLASRDLSLMRARQADRCVQPKLRGRP